MSICLLNIYRYLELFEGVSAPTSIQIVFIRSFDYFLCVLIWQCEKMLLLADFQCTQSSLLFAIMDVALVCDQDAFDISLVIIGAHFIDDHQKCIK